MLRNHEETSLPRLEQIKMVTCPRNCFEAKRIIKWFITDDMNTHCRTVSSLFPCCFKMVSNSSCFSNSLLPYLWETSLSWFCSYFLRTPYQSLMWAPFMWVTFTKLLNIFWISIPDNLFLLHLLIPLTDNCMLAKWKLVTRCVRLFGIPWTVAHQVPLFMELSRQENWSGLPFPPSEDLPNPTMCLTLQNISQAEILLMSCGPLYLKVCSLFLPGCFARHFTIFKFNKLLPTPGFLPFLLNFLMYHQPSPSPSKLHVVGTVFCWLVAF